MDKLRVSGGQRLSGRVAIAGAKNAALPALAACLLTDQPVRLTNLPDVRDVRTMLRVLEQLGADATPIDGGMELTVGKLASHEAPYDLVRTMRASVLVLGPILARAGRARVSLPGGCAIGERPINLHIDGLARMGAEIEIDRGYVEARADRLHGAEIAFPHKTVTGTENLMMAAALAEGTTVLRNAALEPEIVDLADLLNAMGAHVRGAGTDVIEIEGRDRLGGAEHRVIPDRIETGTYLIAAALIGDGVELTGCRPDHIEPILAQLRAAGVGIEVHGDVLKVTACGPLTARDLRTEPHPGFPTDMQAQYVVLMTQAHGTAVISETVFEHRFMHIAELLRMGADIRIDGHTAVVVGPRALTGAQVMATDLRASACLVLAALVAKGTTTIHRIYHLDRGYEAIETKLGALGAAVERIR
ncbi:MAG: UDP-N-acetylglucosamine 1-carboxyvinyltransferase [Acidobacteria bacterium]|nr:UDP-N-acetylglucosamine 1-carboxyvinyltransferase [Acidobacteriota bacterium]